MRGQSRGPLGGRRRLARTQQSRDFALYAVRGRLAHAQDAATIGEGCGAQASGWSLVMKPETFVRVANLSELKGAGPFALSANGMDVVVARTGGGWRAFGGRCPHQGALLGEGE